MKPLMNLSFLVAILYSSLVFSAVPCDFKGLSVGDRVSRSDVMKRLGVKDYKINPKRPNRSADDLDKYDILGFYELVDWKIGPYCNKNSCTIPYGVKVGIDIPVSVYISFDEKSDQILAIDIKANSIYWNDFVLILKNKFGRDWVYENSEFSIANFKTKEAVDVSRQQMNHRVGGRNLATGDSCEIFAVNYDRIFEHPDPLGLYQLVFEIKLISKNF